MKRLTALVACVLTLALSAPALPASAAAGPYSHMWQVQGTVGGDLGGRAVQQVRRDEMTMTLAKGVFGGKLVYEDVVGVQSEAGGITVQYASIEVTLTGSPAAGGSAAAGAFSGTALLLEQAGSSLDDITSGRQDASSSGTQTKYDVAGHWGARLSRGAASGELIFESVHPAEMPGGVGTKELPAAWFNRVTADNPNGLGAGQTFEVEVGGLAATPQSTPATGSRVVAAPGAAAAGRDSAAGGMSFLGFVRRGLSGRQQVQATPVPSAVSQAARALKNAKPTGAVALPATAVAIDVDVSGAFLDAKNRAAGLLGEGGPVGRAGDALRQAWVQSRPALRSPDSRMPLVRSAPWTPEALMRTLHGQVAIPGASQLASDVAAAQQTAAADPTLVDLLGRLIDAVGSPGGAGPALGATVDEERAVASAAIPRTGPLADAVRAAADDLDAPASALAVSAFARDGSRDTSGSATAGAQLPTHVLARAGGRTEGGPATLSYVTATGRTEIAPPAWLAYRRADGVIFWLAGPGGGVALTDGSLTGAGFQLPRAYLVDAARVGRILAVYDLR